MARVSSHRALRRLLTCLALALAAWARPGLAEDQRTASECPRLPEVLAGLGQVLSAQLAEAAAAEIAIRDHGATWDIEVRGRSSSYSDPAHDCAERTRVASVFAALALEPLDADPGPPAPPPPPPPPAVAVAAAPAPPAATPQRRWQLAVQATYDRFSGGQTLAGGDLCAALSWGRWFLTELRAGGRFAAGESLPTGQLTTRAATAAAATGLHLTSPRRTVATAVLVRIQGYLVEFDVEQWGQTHAARLGAWTIAAEPRLTVALTRHFSLQASASLGFALHAIAIRVQGIETRNLSGLVGSGSLGGVFWF